MAFFSQGTGTKLTTSTSEVIPSVVTTSPRMVVDCLVNEHCTTLVIEGHVDLAKAAEAIRREDSGFPAPRHAWMRYMQAPEGELVEDEEGCDWRGECRHSDKGAEPVTISVLAT